MRYIAEVPWMQRLMVLAAVAIVGLSAREAVAATTTLRKKDCTVTNWCSIDQQNCNECCEGVGLCYSSDPEIQGCLCY